MSEHRLFVEIEVGSKGLSKFVPNRCVRKRDLVGNRMVPCVTPGLRSKTSFRVS